MPSNFPYKSRIGFIDAQRYGSLLVEARFTIYKAGRIIGQPYYSHVSLGAFTIDRNAEFRRTGEITLEVNPGLPPPPLMPVDPYSLLAPFGTEIFIETGIASTVYNPQLNEQELSTTAWYPNGLFAISTSEVNDSGANCSITLQLYDRAWTIAQRTLKHPWGFPHTTHGNFVDEIVTLLTTVWNEQINVQPLQFNIVPTDATVPVASYNQGSDPWQAALDMAAAVGYELFFDGLGNVVGRPIPNPLTAPITYSFTDDATYIQGSAGTGSTGLLGSAFSTPIEASVKMTRDNIYNDIIVQGVGSGNGSTYNGNGLQTTTQPILAEAMDTNPLSPTYVGGAMGDVPNFVQSSLVKSGQSAQDMANNDLQQNLSRAWTCTLGVAPNPIFDVNDVVIVNRPRIGMNNALMVIDTVTHTFNYADIMYLTGRILANDNPMQGL